MARLALSIAGGIVGAILALPTGGVSVGLGFSLGSMVGGVIGSLAFPGKGQHVYGARLNDMQVSSSAAGTPIPRLWGAMRLGGQIIWSSGIQEEKTTTKQSAKGGPSVTQTTYAYYCSFAAAFCEGVGIITRMWGDSKLIYDSTGTGQLAANFNVVPTLYTGSETQLADPLISSVEGPNNTPAYRGIVYAVFDKFPLANFGNRLPNIRAEITASATSAYPTTRQTWPDATYYPIHAFTDLQGRTAFYCAGTASSPAASQLIQRVDLSSGQIMASGILPQVTSAFDGTQHCIIENLGTGGAVTVDNDGYIWISNWASRAIYKLDPWTFQILKTVSVTGFFYGAPINLNTYVSEDGISYILGTAYYSSISGYAASGWAMLVLRADSGSVVGQYAYTGQVHQSYPVVDYYGNAYLIYRGPTGSNQWNITKVNIPGGANASNNALFTDAATWNYTGDTSVGIGDALLWNPTDGNLIVLTNTGAFLRIDSATGAILEQVGSQANQQFPAWNGTGTLESGQIGGFGVFKYDSGYDCFIQTGLRGRAQNGFILVPDVNSATNGNLNAISAADFSILATYNMGLFPDRPQGSSWDWVGANNTSMSSYWAYVPQRNMLCCVGEWDKNAAGYPSTFTSKWACYQLFFGRLSTNGAVAADVALSVCEAAGIDAANVDTSLISNLSVIGYPVVQLQNGSSILSALMKTLFFEARETDFKLQFIPRGQSAIVTIPEDDLGLAADNTKLEETVGQEQDVPKEVEVVFIDPAQDYQQNKQHKIRHSRTKKTVNKTSINLPVVLNARDAERLADRILWTAESERDNFKANLWRAYYLLLDPCDVVQFTYDNALITARISENTIGQNYASAVQFVREDSNNYVSISSGNADSGFIAQIIQGLADTQLWLLDIPYLQDSDADSSGNTGFYFGAAPSDNGTWGAGVLYQSADASSYNQISASGNAIGYGIAQNAPGAPRSVYTWDNTNSLTIRLVRGNAPSSDTTLNVLNGSNAVLLYPSLEVLQFTTATNNGDGTYTLSGLLRGRRGTEWACVNHNIGEIAILLPDGGLVHEQVSLSLVGLKRYYKAITAGADINSTRNIQTLTLKGRDLMPYAPCQIAGQLSGSDWVFGWMRRTRLGGGWFDGTDIVPLAEDGQGYALDICDSSWNIKRTVYVTQNRFTYTAAMQTADFGATQSTVYLQVTQLSAQVGRGFIAQKVISTSVASLPPLDSATALSNPSTAGQTGSGWLVNGS
jgi:hypothetical protein